MFLVNLIFLAVAVAASAYTLVVIAIERYFAIVQPLRYIFAHLHQFIVKKNLIFMFIFLRLSNNARFTKYA